MTMKLFIYNVRILRNDKLYAIMITKTEDISMSEKNNQDMNMGQNMGGQQPMYNGMQMPYSNGQMMNNHKLLLILIKIL